MEKVTKNLSKITTSGFTSDREGKFSIEIKSVDTYFIDTNGNEGNSKVESLDKAMICEEQVNLNGKFAIECELIVSKKNNIDVVIDDTGNLLISGEDHSNYEINDQGELIYKY